MLNVVPVGQIQKQQQTPQQKELRKVIFFNKLSPGDIVILSAFIRDLKQTVPAVEIDVRTPCPDIFLNNPWLSKLNHEDKDVSTFEAHYPSIHTSNITGNRYIYGFHEYFDGIFNRRINRGPFCGDIHLSSYEKEHNLALEKYGIKGDYWLIQHGVKSDFTVKLWSTARMQRVVDAFKGKISFVQVGATSATIKTADNVFHSQEPLKNVVNLIDQTTLRELILLTHRAEGCLGPESLLAHLAMAIQIPTTSEVVKSKIDGDMTSVDWRCKQCGKEWNTKHPGKHLEKDFIRHDHCRNCGRNVRANIVIASGMCSPSWMAYGDGYISKCGALKCNTEFTTGCGASAGCWRNRTVKLSDNHEKNSSLCVNPIEIVEDGIKQTIPQCMNLISAEEIIAKIHTYYSTPKISTLGPYLDGTNNIPKIIS